MTLYKDENYINTLLAEAAGTPADTLAGILDKAARFEGLTHREVAALLTMEQDSLWDRVFDIADTIKRHIYGDRVVMFAPLYVSDYCVNQCAYCGFSGRHAYPRRRLTMDEVRREAKILTRMGHKRLAIEAGEDPENCPLSYVLEVIRTIYTMETDNKGDAIRRVNINIAATGVEEYRQLKQAGIGTYILFQETYHRPTYERVHISGPKADYDWHAESFDRAMEAGIDDVGGGVLFGLHDYRYEVLGLMLHNEHLEQRFGVGFHTISLPRIRYAEGAVETNCPHAVSDRDFLRLTAVVRLAVPFTGMIISTRETPDMRRKLIKIGVSQLSGGSTVEVGGYALRENKKQQFQVADERRPQDILLWLMEEGLIPSFCTACYRNGRTGDRFMQLAKSGEIKHVCLPNALMTLAEYAEDYGMDVFRSTAGALIETKLQDIPDESVRARITDNIARIRAGERDLFV